MESNVLRKTNNAFLSCSQQTTMSERLTTDKMLIGITPDILGLAFSVEKLLAVYDCRNISDLRPTV